jgi:hypothetical protein
VLGVAALLPLAATVLCAAPIGLHPDNSVITGGIPVGGTARALVEPGKAYAIYVRQPAATGPFSARWSGIMAAPVTGDLLLHTYSNDGVRLWVNDQLPVDKWVDQAEVEHIGTLAVIAGRKLRVKLAGRMARHQDRQIVRRHPGERPRRCDAGRDGVHRRHCVAHFETLI